MKTIEEALRYQRHLCHKHKKVVEASIKYRSRLVLEITPAEVWLKKLLEMEEIKYEFQYLIYDKYKYFMADFYLPDYHLIIELDGNQHFTIDGMKKDIERSEVLQKLGFDRLIRFANSDIMNFTTHSLKSLLADYQLVI